CGGSDNENPLAGRSWHCVLVRNSVCRDRLIRITRVDCSGSPRVTKIGDSGRHRITDNADWDGVGRLRPTGSEYFRHAWEPRKQTCARCSSGFSNNDSVDGPEGEWSDAHRDPCCGGHWIVCWDREEPRLSS